MFDEWADTDTRPALLAGLEAEFERSVKRWQKFGVILCVILFGIVVAAAFAIGSARAEDKMADISILLGMEGKHLAATATKQKTYHRSGVATSTSELKFFVNEHDRSFTMVELREGQEPLVRDGGRGWMQTNPPPLDEVRGDKSQFDDYTHCAPFGAVILALEEKGRLPQVAAQAPDQNGFIFAISPAGEWSLIWVLAEQNNGREITWSSSANACIVAEGDSWVFHAPT